MALRSDGSPPRSGSRSGVDAGAASTAAGAVSFDYLAEIAVGATTRVDLCRIIEGPRAGQLCAVKRLHPHIAEDPGIATQFVDEVWMTAALRHPNVVEVAGWGEDAHGTYLAVELVQGVSLARLMKTVFETGEVFSERMVVYVASRLCRGLAAAHSLRGPDGELLHLVHRDLTPGNVLTSFDGVVKIADFGLAKAKQRLTKTLTGLLKGQPAYMSPEHARGKEVDARSDLFSLGVMLFELFSGRRPWSPPSEIDVVQAMLTEPPADLRELRPKIDRELVAVVSKCLEKDPAARFQSAGEIQQRLETWLAVHGYNEGNEEALARFVRRNAMRQMRWFERAIAGELGASSRPAPPPRAVSNTSTSNQPLQIMPQRPPSEPRRPKARTRKAANGDADATDVADLAPKVALLHQRGIPAVRGAPPEIDWGEELPTLVQSSSAAPGKSRLPRAHVPDILEEESDGRTTAVKRPGRPPTLLSAGVPRPVRVIADADSEDMPTMPIDARLRDLLDVPHARGAAPAQTAPPAAARPPIAEPPSEETRPREERAPAPARAAEPTAELVRAEAERLAAEAARLVQAAREAASAAARAEAVSRMASEAAAIAAEAARSLPAVGLARAAQRLEQAIALEGAAKRGDLRIVSVDVPPSAALAAQAQPAAPASQPQAALAPRTPAPPASQSAPQSAPPPSAVYVPPSAPPPAYAPAVRWPASGVPAPPIPAGAYETAQRPARPEAPRSEPGKLGTFDALVFRARLKPMLWGMPLPLALAFAAGILFLGVLVLWLLVT
jgi:serine/threonine-protein kinase